MGTRNFFSHIDPDNVGPFFRISKLHRRYIGTGGENIIKLTKDSNDRRPGPQNRRQLDEQHRAPPEHLNKDYTMLGVGVVEMPDPNNTPFIYATQLFGTPAGYLQQDFPWKSAPTRKKTWKSNA